MDGALRMLLFDAYHDEYRGVICLVEVVDGALRLGDRVQAMSTGDLHDVLEVRRGRGQSFGLRSGFEMWACVWCLVTCLGQGYVFGTCSWGWGRALCLGPMALCVGLDRIQGACNERGESVLSAEAAV